jgi:hypothetical protein
MVVLGSRLLAGPGRGRSSDFSGGHRGTTCLPKASFASISERVSGSGISSWSTTRSGTTFRRGGAVLLPPCIRHRPFFIAEPRHGA